MTIIVKLLIALFASLVVAGIVVAIVFGLPKTNDSPTNTSSPTTNPSQTPTPTMSTNTPSPMPMPTPTNTPSPTLQNFSRLPRLFIKDRNISFMNGTLVELRGVNIGGWLYHEGWMCGAEGTGFPREQSYHDTLENRFGKQSADLLMNIWVKNWMTTQDLDEIRSYGFNYIRVPFSYRNVLNSDLTWRLDSNGNIDFSPIDWIVDEAGKRGMWVLLCFHEWYGRAIQYDAISRNQYSSGMTPAEINASNFQRKIAVMVLQEYVKRYANCTTVFGIDMINEPTGSAGNVLQTTLFDGIRQIDPNMIVVVEWFTGIDPRQYGWKNVVYSGHWYHADVPAMQAEAKTEFDLISAYAVPIPYLVGEFHGTDDFLREVSKTSKFYGFSWTKWTYKTVNMGGWGLFNYYASSLNLDPRVAPYEEILQKWNYSLIQWLNKSAPVNIYRSQGWVAGAMA